MKITIDTKYQVVTGRDYSLCKPVKTPITLDFLSGTLSLSTGYPQPLWRALFALVSPVFLNKFHPAEGGIGKVYQLFGEELWGMLEELNEVLAA